MQILITDSSKGRLSQLSAGWLLISLILFAILSIIGAAGYAGYYLGSHQIQNREDVEVSSIPHDQLFISKALSEELDVQKVRIDTAVVEAQENLNALAMRLGTLQAKITRLEALSSRLTEIVGIPAREFDFEQAPAMGGLEDPLHQQEFTVPDFIEELEKLSDQIDEKEHQLGVLDHLILDNKLELAAVPSGKPVASGWLSSKFGKRTDPVTGKREFHKGIDLAGQKGTEIHAVASGVVTWSGKQKGYGNIVEIDHGHGYITRYAHNEKNLVKVGDKVEKGQVIALMGSTGHSTGNHVHFEVEQNGKLVDPRPYLKPLG